jgi:hypothetical protein
MNVDELFDQPTVNRNLPLHKRYDAEKIKGYEDDLRAIVAKVGEGKVCPATTDIAKYVKSKYGIVVFPTTIRRHLDTLTAGEPLWPTSTT